MYYFEAQVLLLRSGKINILPTLFKLLK